MATAATAVLNALVIGGTGATGKCLMGVLLRDKERFGKVILVTRRKLESVAEEYKVNLKEEEESGRLVQHVQDLDEVTKEKIVELCNGVHVFFNTLGTTRSAAGSAQAFYHIDCDIPFKFAEAAKEAGVSHMSLLTSVGSKSSSMFLYLRTKGELEDKVRALQFPHTSIHRPGGLNRGQTDRFFEKLAGYFFKGLPVSNLAAAMAWDAATAPGKGQTSGDPTVTIIDSKQVFNTMAQEYLKKFIPVKEKSEESTPQTEETQPKEGESLPQAQQPETAEGQSKTEEAQPQAQPQAEKAQPQTEEAQPQTEEAQPQTEEAQPQAEDTQPKAEEAQPKAEEEAQPQAEEAQPQAEEAQPQAEEAQPQAEETQPQAEETQPQAEETQPQSEESLPQAEETQPKAEEEAQAQTEEDQPQVNETQEDSEPKAEETETKPEEPHPEADETPSQGDEA